MEQRDLDIIYNNSINWQMYRDKTVFVTGATGRLGQYYLDTLVSADLKYNLNMKIYGVARNKGKVKKIFSDLLDLPNVYFIYKDINENIDFHGTIDYIFHTAGPAAPKDFKEDPVGTLWSHVNGTHNILELARTHNTKRIFYVSTVEIYGEWTLDRYISENDMGVMQHFNSRACYPEAKRLCETMLKTYQKEYGISFCGVRMSHTLGPGISLKDGRAFAEFLKCVLDGENIILHSDGSAMRTYTYVADAINASFLIMEKGEDYLYNVANIDNLISIRDLANLIAKLSTTGKTQVKYGNDIQNFPYLPFKLAVLNVDKIKALGWHAQVDLMHTFEWTLNSFSHSEELENNL